MNGNNLTPEDVYRIQNEMLMETNPCKAFRRKRKREEKRTAE